MRPNKNTHNNLNLRKLSSSSDFNYFKIANIPEISSSKHNLHQLLIQNNIRGINSLRNKNEVTNISKSVVRALKTMTKRSSSTVIEENKNQNYAIEDSKLKGVETFRINDKKTVTII